MAVASGIETVHNVIDLQAPPEAMHEPFHFARPEWLREGRLVHVEWIDTAFTLQPNTYSALDAQGRPFTYTHQQRTSEYEFVSLRGEVTKAFPVGEAARREAANRIAATLHIRPFRQPRFNDDDTLSIIQPPTKIILLDHFDDYIFTALRPRIPAQR